VRLGDADELERALHHAERRVAVAVHDPVGERAVVRADAHRPAELLAAQHERRKRLVQPLQLAVVVRVGVLAHGELLLVGVVAGVHADLLDVLDRLHRGDGRKWMSATSGTWANPAALNRARMNFAADAVARGTSASAPRTATLRSEAVTRTILAADLGEGDRLRARSPVDVLRVAGRHRLRL
jgi:hypothetical protein